MVDNAEFGKRETFKIRINFEKISPVKKMIAETYSTPYSLILMSHVMVHVLSLDSLKFDGFYYVHNSLSLISALPVVDNSCQDGGLRFFLFAVQVFA